jgi:hypothetical protein
VGDSLSTLHASRFQRALFVLGGAASVLAGCGIDSTVGGRVAEGGFDPVVAAEPLPPTPWRVGDAIAGRWRVEDVARHPEYVRLTARRGSRTASVEVTYARGGTDAWQTTYYRVQAAPNATADAELMGAIVSTLRALESARGHVPFVRPVERRYGGFDSRAVIQSSASASGWVFAPDTVARALQLGWLLLAVAALPLAVLCGNTLAVPARQAVLVVLAPFVLSLALTWSRPSAPPHANGHAWREAREVMAPWEGGQRGMSPYLHGRGGIAAQWTIAALQRLVGLPRDPLAGTTRVPIAAACGGTALLVLVITRRSGAALLGGVLFALASLSRTLAVSGSSLAITAAAFPWSLALSLAALRSGSVPLLAAASIAAALASSSHTAALSWLPAVSLACWLGDRDGPRLSFRRWIPWTAVPLGAWLFHLVGQASMLAERNARTPLLGQMLDSWHHGVLVDPSWTSPALLVLAVGSAFAAVRCHARSGRLATLAALVVACPPFLTPNVCASDAVRYQTCLLPLIVALASDGLVIAAQWLGRALGARPLLPAGVLATACLVPFELPRPPDLAIVEHEFVSAVVGHVPSPAVVVLPERRDWRVRHDFPDFLLPRGVVVMDTAEQTGPAAGPRLVYAGVACASWPRDASAQVAARDPGGLRPECRELIAGATPWRTFVLQPSDLPPRTYHDVATGIRLGFFRLRSSAESAAVE